MLVDISDIKKDLNEQEKEIFDEEHNLPETEKYFQRLTKKEIISKMKYEYKGNVYNYVGVGKFKDSTGKWVDAIIYERDNHIYMREITDFIDKFKKV